MARYILLWLPMLLIAIANGAIREMVIKKYVDTALAHQLSTILLLILFSVYAWLVVRYFPMKSGQQAIWVGICWLLLTLAFEFGFGLYSGKSWGDLLAEYNILKGKLWILIPAWLLVSPYIFFKIFLHR